MDGGMHANYTALLTGGIMVLILFHPKIFLKFLGPYRNLISCTCAVIVFLLCFTFHFSTFLSTKIYSITDFPELHHTVSDTDSCTLCGHACALVTSIGSDLGPPDFSGRIRSPSPICAMREKRRMPVIRPRKESFTSGRRFVDGERKEVRFSNQHNTMHEMYCYEGEKEIYYPLTDVVCYCGGNLGYQRFGSDQNTLARSSRL